MSALGRRGSIPVSLEDAHGGGLDEGRAPASAAGRRRGASRGGPGPPIASRLTTAATSSRHARVRAKCRCADTAERAAVGRHEDERVRSAPAARPRRRSASRTSARARSARPFRTRCRSRRARRRGRPGARSRRSPVEPAAHRRDGESSSNCMAAVPRERRPTNGCARTRKPYEHELLRDTSRPRARPGAAREPRRIEARELLGERRGRRRSNAGGNAGGSGQRLGAADAERGQRAAGVRRAATCRGTCGR